MQIGSRTWKDLRYITYGLKIMKEIDNRVKLHNKPFEEMELEELYAEKMARKWHRHKVINAKNKISMKKYWLEENKPILSVEEIHQKYENGELTENQYRTAFANRKKAIDYRMRIDDYMTYADRIVYDEESVIAFIDDCIAIRESVPKQKKKKLGRRSYDPRKRVSKNNPSPLDPNRKWATRKPPKKLPKLQYAKGKWRSKHEVKTMNVMKRMQPIITWDTEKLMAVARDRGFFTDVAVIATIAQTLNISVSGTEKLIRSGKLSWSQCIIIGALFEMTPKEFCDVFLSGYFKEVADGVFKAHVDDIEALLDTPYQAVPRLTEGDKEQ